MTHRSLGIFHNRIFLELNILESIYESNQNNLHPRRLTLQY